MPSKSFEIRVQEDHLERIAQTRKPTLALAELLWNAVDADATRVNVTLESDGLGGISAIHIIDNGHAIPHADAETLFSNLGGSWKQARRRSQTKNRILHGKEGRGRFRAFALGRVVDWDVCYARNGQLFAYRMSMVGDNLKKVNLDDEAPARSGGRRGVTVRISELLREYRSLRADEAVRDLTQIFALYLREYRDVEIYYDGLKLDPAGIEEASATYPLPPVNTPTSQTPFPSRLK